MIMSYDSINLQFRKDLLSAQALADKVLKAGFESFGKKGKME
jgi:hypothetical protein